MGGRAPPSRLTLHYSQRAAAGGATLIDVIAYPFIDDVEKVLVKYPEETWYTYENNLKIGGVEITIEGSPRGKTALSTRSSACMRALPQATRVKIETSRSSRWPLRTSR